MRSSMRPAKASNQLWKSTYYLIMWNFQLRESTPVGYSTQPSSPNFYRVQGMKSLSSNNQTVYIDRNKYIYIYIETKIYGSFW